MPTRRSAPAANARSPPSRPARSSTSCAAAHGVRPQSRRPSSFYTTSNPTATSRQRVDRPAADRRSQRRRPSRPDHHDHHHPSRLGAPEERIRPLPSAEPSHPPGPTHQGPRRRTRRQPHRPARSRHHAGAATARPDRRRRRSRRDRPAGLVTSRTHPLRRRVRCPGRRITTTSLIRQHHPTPTQPRAATAASTEPSTPSPWSAWATTPHPGLRHPPHRQRPHQTRGHAQPQALHQQVTLPDPGRHPHGRNHRLTVTKASQSGLTRISARHAIPHWEALKR
ncbi:hypothetical protein GA0070616_3312 [Micromonospora nigra]|uniref:Uncharacterized protein n=1 Tax=Micromonospora nigra TaxID=145857 RepID=A0A1C6SB10_9ACTN|nr:hypothetical protein GA0070616_3312 [Micromonospora nigra]